MNESDLLEAIESLIDRHGLSAVLGFIADVCREKAEHIRTTWQDNGLAMEWEVAARLVENVAMEVPV